MKKEVKSLLKKTAKIAGVTCAAAGMVAVVTSGAALKAIGEGGRYLVDAVKKIVKEEPKAENVVEAVPNDFAPEEEMPQQETAEAGAEETV